MSNNYLSSHFRGFLKTVFKTCGTRSSPGWPISHFDDRPKLCTFAVYVSMSHELLVRHSKVHIVRYALLLYHVLIRYSGVPSDRKTCALLPVRDVVMQ